MDIWYKFILRLKLLKKVGRSIVKILNLGTLRATSPQWSFCCVAVRANSYDDGIIKVDVAAPTVTICPTISLSLLLSIRSDISQFSHESHLRRHPLPRSMIGIFWYAFGLLQMWWSIDIIRQLFCIIIRRLYTKPIRWSIDRGR